MMTHLGVKRFNLKKISLKSIQWKPRSKLKTKTYSVLNARVQIVHVTLNRKISFMNHHLFECSVTIRSLHYYFVTIRSDNYIIRKLAVTSWGATI